MNALGWLGFIIFIAACGAELVAPKYSRTERSALNWQVIGLLLIVFVLARN